MHNLIQNICNQFNIYGNITRIKTFTSGHINSTYLIDVSEQDSLKQFVLQRINHNVFKNPDNVMDNITNVTNHIKQQIRSKGEHSSRRVLRFYPTNNGKYYYEDNNGDYWRIYKYVNNSITFDNTENLKVLEETGKAFGEFQLLLDKYPIKDLHIIIPHFHNTVNRYKIFRDTISNNPVNRAQNVQTEINEFLMLEDLATKMYKMQKNNELPLRVTHNDTKCNNVLFDKNTNNHLCVIDLDTVMPGLVGFDFGDAIRFAANTCKEDETNLEMVKLDLEKFEAFTRGFLSEVGSHLTPKELETLSLGAITMSIECGLRFLTDYIDGDNYFKISYEDHNLDRACCQLALAQDMIKNYYQMQQIVENCIKEYNIN